MVSASGDSTFNTHSSQCFWFSGCVNNEISLLVQYSIIHRQERKKWVSGNQQELDRSPVFYFYCFGLREEFNICGKVADISSAQQSGRTAGT